MQAGTVLVVIAHYAARPVDKLVALLRSMSFVPAGWPLATRVVVNRDGDGSLRLPADLSSTEVLHRENTGFNIGAWDHGWRVGPPHAAYLFLQDECQIVRPGWVEAFVRKSASGRVGLVGECLSPDWDAPWEELSHRTRDNRLPEHLVGGSPASRVGCYLDFLRREGIPPGPRGDHLQSLVLFARRKVLEAIGGFPVGRNYGEAIAAEIGITKKVQALGLEVCEVGPEPFHYILHPQWLHRKGQRRQAGEAGKRGGSG